MNPSVHEPVPAPETRPAVAKKTLGPGSSSVHTWRQTFSVPFDYPIHFGRGFLSPDQPLLADSMDRFNEPGKRRVWVCLDEGVAAARPDLPGRVEGYLAAYADRLESAGKPLCVPGGEKAKESPRAVTPIVRQLAAHRLCRQSIVLAIGGGSMLDLVGLAAALVHRGLRLVRMPTSVLSQNDSGMGVKNGIDAYGAKNFLGTFAPPFAVLSDFDFLSTLPEPYRLGGLAEAFKVAMIRDASFFDYLCRNTDRLRNNDSEIMEETIRRCAFLHLAHIRDGGDPFEFGAARPLDFGHWAAHRLEVLSDYSIGHGQAVAIGMALDSYVAWKQGLLTREEFVSVLDAFSRTGLPVWSSFLEQTEADGTPALRRGLDDFREHLGGALTVTLPDGLGQGVEVHHLDWAIVAQGIRYLKGIASNERGT